MSPKKDAAWHEARRRSIGASDIACVMGCGFKSPYALWAEKTGLLSPGDESEDPENFFWGTALEGAILEALGGPRYLGEPVEVWQDTLARPMDGIRGPVPATATPDGAVVRAGGRIPVEVKNVSSFSGSQWADGPPDRYRMQSIWQQLVCDADIGVIAALVGGQRLIWAECTGSSDERQEMLDAASSFWHEHVLPRVPPPVDSHSSTHEAIRMIFPRPTADDLIILGDEFSDIDAEIVRLKAQEKEISSAIKAAEAKIKAAIGSAHVAVLPSGDTYSWRLQSRPEMVVKASDFRVLRRHANKEHGNVK